MTTFTRGARGTSPSKCVPGAGFRVRAGNTWKRAEELTTAQTSGCSDLFDVKDGPESLQELKSLFAETPLFQ